MFRVFGMGNDPVSGGPLGSRPYQINADRRASVAGFDLTFSAPKSVSAWWAVADGHTQQVIVDAHHAALRACVGLLETQVAATRIGRNGVAQAEVRGLVAAGFDHWDSRAGDPQLHTHLVVANRVQTRDGKWRTLDSRALYRSIVAVSETYNGLLADELSRRLGVSWNERTRRHSAVPGWEIADVPDELISAFSQRSRAIEAHKNGLVRAFVDTHGRQPTNTEVLRLRQRATLATRPDKQSRSLAELCERWRERASDVLGMDGAAWAKGVGADASNRWVRTADVPDEQHRKVAASVLRAMEEKRSTWSRWNLHAEASRQLMGIRFTSIDDRLTATARVVDLAIGESTLLTAPQLAPTPEAFRRLDGTSMFTHKNNEKYTSRTLLDAEDRLLDAGRDTADARVVTALVEQAIEAPPPGRRYPLGPDQAAAVRAIATSGRVLDVLVGPAGTGKTVTLAGLRAAWEARHGPGSVVGLAPSASAAEVLAGELGIPTENTAKWLTEHDHESARLAEIDRCRMLLHRTGRNPRAEHAIRAHIDGVAQNVERWRLHPGQLIILDEASLAGTLTLDRITIRARAAGAKVLLVGDWAQLSAIDAGGAFTLLVHDRADPPELGAVRRFTHRWERSASRRLRLGDTDVIATYERHGRIHGGDSDAMLDAAHRAWVADETAGRRSLIIAGDSATVAALNARARDELVTGGRVQPDGVALRSGAVAGVGDRVVTRRNDRTLATTHGFVKNGDTWTVAGRRADGSLTVRKLTGGPSITLPRAYIAEHVDLAYATTAYRAQGATVDTAHAVIAASAMTREALYVSMTRGRHANTAYVITEPAGEDCDSGPQRRAACDMLTAVLPNVGADASARDVIRAEQDRAASITQLADEYETIAATLQQPRWARLLEAGGLSDMQVRDVIESPAYGALATALRRAEAHGLPVDKRLPELVAARALADADVAAVLHERVTRWTYSSPLRPQLSRIIAGLIPVADVDGLGAERALRERGDMIEQRAFTLVRRAIHDGEPWIAKLGRPPAEPTRRAAWIGAAQIVAAYRDRYPDGSPRPPSYDETEAARTAATLSRSGSGQPTLDPTRVARDRIAL
jgi:conjugative relaxase-like TrwC/TraI family protein